MGRARDREQVELAPARAFELWTDLRRWPAFIDGFGHVLSSDSSWPAEGSELRWRSVPDGRGDVGEVVVECEPGARLVTRVADDSLTGVQAVVFDGVEEAAGGAAAGEGTSIYMELEYELVQPGVLGPVVDLLFIRRTIRDSLERTLRGFGEEAREAAGRDVG